MTLVYLPRHVDQLISEIKSEWTETNDPDMDRVADAFPLHVLEKAYLKKLGCLRTVDVGRCATGPRQKLAVLRKIYDSWLRAPGVELGQLISEVIGGDSDQFTAETLVFGGDAHLASLFEKRYPAKK